MNLGGPQRRTAREAEGDEDVEDDEEDEGRRGLDQIYERGDDDDRIGAGSLQMSRSSIGDGNHGSLPVCGPGGS